MCFFENSVDRNHLVPEKPADQNHPVFHSACMYLQITGVLQVNWIKNLGEVLYIKIFSMARVKHANLHLSYDFNVIQWIMSCHK